MVSDLSLTDYIAVDKNAYTFLPHTQGRYQKRAFRKALCPIVERLCCSMMMHGRNNGKKLMAVRIVKHAFEIIHLLTDKNPIQVRCGRSRLPLFPFPFCCGPFHRYPRNYAEFLWSM